MHWTTPAKGISNILSLHHCLPAARNTNMTTITAWRPNKTTITTMTMTMTQYNPAVTELICMSIPVWVLLR